MFGAVLNKGDWPRPDKFTLLTTREKALHNYAEFNPIVKKQFKLVGENINTWALFDTGDHPVPHFNKDHIVLCGDTAHAMSSRHGAGAGFCVDDSVLLADERVADAQDLPPPPVFAAFDAVRRPRGHWIV